MARRLARTVLKTMLKNPLHVRQISGISIAFAILHASPAHALARYDAYINLSSTTKWSLNDVISFKFPFNDNKSIDGDSVGSATESHIDPDDILASNIECIFGPGGKCTGELGVKMIASGSAYYPPGGYAWTSGSAQTGFTIELKNDALISLILNEIVDVSVSTSRPGESARANFKYQVLWNDKVVEGILSNPSQSQTFASVDGACVTATCGVIIDKTYIQNLQGVKGVNTFLIDPVFDNDAVAVPAPLPLLGISGAFCYSRKLRHRIKTSKPS